MFIVPFGFEDFGLDVEPMSDAPTDEEHFEFEHGVITGYSDDGPKDVVIPSKIDGHRVTEIGNNTFYHKGLSSVQLPDSVEVN